MVLDLKYSFCACFYPVVYLIHNAAVVCAAFGHWGCRCPRVAFRAVYLQLALTSCKYALHVQMDPCKNVASQW